MSGGLFAQYAVVALAVLVSVGYVARRQFPAAVRRMRILVAVPLVREGRAPWVQRLGRAIAPPGQGPGSGCDGCGGCG
jgi:hypothetical protein